MYANVCSVPDLVWSVLHWSVVLCSTLGLLHSVGRAMAIEFRRRIRLALFATPDHFALRYRMGRETHTFVLSSRRGDCLDLLLCPSIRTFRMRRGHEMLILHAHSLGAFHALDCALEYVNHCIAAANSALRATSSSASQSPVSVSESKADAPAIAADRALVIALPRDGVRKSLLDNLVVFQSDAVVLRQSLLW